MTKFDAARWMVDAMMAGIDVRRSANGHLLELRRIYGGDETPRADRLESEMDEPENYSAVMALLPMPGTDPWLLH